MSTIRNARFEPFDANSHLDEPEIISIPWVKSAQTRVRQILGVSNDNNRPNHSSLRRAPES